MKNIENVQGYERDVILMSVGYPERPAPSEVRVQRLDATATSVGDVFVVDFGVAPKAARLENNNVLIAWSGVEDQNEDGVGVYGRLFTRDFTPLTDSFQMNSFTPGYQWISEVAPLFDGDFWVVWEADGQEGDGQGIFAMRFASDQSPEGAELQVNTSTSGDQYGADVAALSDGGFNVTWERRQPTFLRRDMAPMGLPSAQKPA